MDFLTPRQLIAPFDRFLRREDASLSIEAAVMLPVLGFIYVAGFGYFDAYRKDTVMTKATYVIGDLLSRKETAITPADLEGLQNLFDYLTFSEGNGWIRTTEVIRNGDAVDVVWTYATDGNPHMTDARLQGYLDQIPTLADGERTVLVESFATYEPRFNIGLEPRTFEHLIATSQRYAPRLICAGCVVGDGDINSVAMTSSGQLDGIKENGWGNSTSGAPGNSGPNNNAANGGGSAPQGLVLQPTTPVPSTADPTADPATDPNVLTTPVTDPATILPSQTLSQDQIDAVTALYDDVYAGITPVLEYQTSCTATVLGSCIGQSDPIPVFTYQDPFTFETVVIPAEVTGYQSTCAVPGLFGTCLVPGPDEPIYDLTPPVPTAPDWLLDPLRALLTL